MIYISLACTIVIILAFVFREKLRGAPRSWAACSVKAVINDAVVIKCGFRITHCSVADDGTHVDIRCRRELVEDAS
jgi:hypothetical protein